MNRTYIIVLMRRIKKILSTLSLEITSSSIREARAIAERQYPDWRIQSSGRKEADERTEN
jgi:hypothetical protein